MLARSGVVAGCVVTAMVSVAAQQAAAPSTKALNILYIAGAKFNASDPLKKETTFSSLYLVSGGGRHSVALAVEEGFLLVDTKGAGWGSALSDKLSLTSDGSVVTVIDTSPSGAGANGEFPDAKEVIAHADTKAMLAKNGASAKTLPNKTFTDSLLLTVKIPGEPEGRNKVELFHFGPGHSAGDTIVLFHSYGVAVFGDLLPGKELPIIDTAHGGSAVALPDTLDKAVAGLKDKGVDTIIPGRAAPPPKAVLRWISMRDLQEYAAFNRAFLDATREALGGGLTVDAATTKVTQVVGEKFKGYGLDRARATVEAIYAELKK